LSRDVKTIYTQGISDFLKKLDKNLLYVKASILNNQYVIRGRKYGREKIKKRERESSKRYTAAH